MGKKRPLLKKKTLDKKTFKKIKPFFSKKNTPQNMEKNKTPLQKSKPLPLKKTKTLSNKMNPGSSEQLEKKRTPMKKKNLCLRNSRKAFVFLLKKTCEKKKTLEPFVGVENYLKKTLEEKNKNHSKKKTL